MAMYAHLAHLSVYEVNLKHMRECKNLIIYLRDYHVLNSAFISETLFFFVFFCFLFFYLILYVPSTIFQLNRDGSSWDEPVLS